MARRGNQKPRWLEDRENNQSQAARANGGKTPKRKAGDPVGGGWTLVTEAKESAADDNISTGVYSLPMTMRVRYTNTGWVTSSGSWSWGTLTSEPEDTTPLPTPESRTEPVRGWRAFNLDWNNRDPARLMLYGLHWGMWEGNTLEAECIGGQHWISMDDQPNVNNRERLLAHLLDPTACTCGIYAGPTTEGLEFGTPIVGQVVGWGTVVMDERGVWRASDATIERLVINKRFIANEWWGQYIDVEKLAYDLSALYGVPVAMVEKLSDLEQPQGVEQ